MQIGDKHRKDANRISTEVFLRQQLQVGLKQQHKIAVLIQSYKRVRKRQHSRREYEAA